MRSAFTSTSFPGLGEEAYKPFSASDDTEEERNEVRGRGGLVLLEEELYLFHNLEPYSYLKPQTWELNPLPLLLQAHLSSFLPLALLRGEQEHLYAAFLPDVGLPGSENTAMMISIIASFFSFFQNLGANAIATGASPVTSVSESFSGSITRIGAKDACNRKLSQRASIQINS
ncbi:hypothetical protein V6N13_072325 [Hibiscus sabdariffa]